MKQVLIVILLVSGFLSAQSQSKRIVADRIIAQVGDKIILSSDVSNALADIRRQAQGQDNVILPTDFGRSINTKGPSAAGTKRFIDGK